MELGAKQWEASHQQAQGQEQPQTRQEPVVQLQQSNQGQDRRHPSGRKYDPVKRKERYEKNKEYLLAYKREWYLKNRERVIEQSKTWNKNSPDKRREYKQRHNRKLKEECMSHYSGNGFIQCCYDDCNIRDLDMLVLDHINNGGNKHRKSISKSGRGGNFIYKYLRDHGYPLGFQVLCANHNLKKEIERHRR